MARKPTAEETVLAVNYVWNLRELTKPGALDTTAEEAVEELARRYAEADAGEGIVRPSLTGKATPTVTFDHRTGQWAFA